MRQFGAATADFIPMPNWTYNMLVVEGDPASVEHFLEEVKGADEAGAVLLLDFEQLLPTPPESLDSTEWRDWRREQWGTKWNASDVRVTGSPEDGRVHYRFTTAWRPPDGWLSAVSAAHPTLDLRLEYVEEMLHFAGRAHLRAGLFVTQETIDPSTSGWWLETDSEYERAGEPNCMDPAAVERAAAAIWDLTEKLTSWRSAGTSSADRLGLIVEQIGRASRAGRLLAEAGLYGIDAEEATDESGQPLLRELCTGLALAAADALLASTRFRQIDETYIGPGARDAEWREVVETVRDQDFRAHGGPLALDWILKALGWANELNATLAERARENRGETVAEWLLDTHESTANAARVQFQLIASECTAALALFAPDDLDLGDVEIPGSPEELADVD